MASRVKKQLFEPVLGSSRPKGSRSTRVRGLVDEVEQSRLLAEDGATEVVPRGIGDGDLQARGDNQARVPGEGADKSESESASMSSSATTTTISNGRTGGGGIECFNETGLSADIQQCVVSQLAQELKEPEMIGPCVHFRAITEQDQDDCKLRRAAASMKSMTQASSEGEAVGTDASFFSSSSKRHIASCTCANCRDNSFLNGQQQLQEGHNNRGGLYKIVATSTRLVMDVLEAHGFKRLPGTNLPAPPPANGKPRKGAEWSLLWSGKHLPLGFYRSNIMSPHQRVNMFPSAFECTKKDALSRNLNRMAQIHGKRHFKFATESYTLPKEREGLLEAMTNTPGAWIVKPAGSSQGKGIYIIEGASASSPSVSPSPPRKGGTSGASGGNSVRRKRNKVLRALPTIELAKQLPDCSNAKDNFVVERYIHSPYLIDARKFDLRLYVVVTSFEPLKVYIHGEGLIRLASCEYSTASGSFGDRYSHLTNYSINKNHAAGSASSAGVGAGSTPVGSGRAAAGAGASVPSTPTAADHDHTVGESQSHSDGETEVEGSEKEGGGELGIKLRLAELGPRMGIGEEEQGTLWAKIDDLVIKTFISIESKVCVAMRTHCPLPEACFELFGFDVLIDTELNPWLMEVNFAPSLAADTPLDFEVKSAVLADTFTLCGVRKSPLGGSSGAVAAVGESASRRAYNSGGRGGRNPLAQSHTPVKATQGVSMSPGHASPGPLSPGGKSDGFFLASGAIDTSVLAAPISDREKRIVSSFKKECCRAQRTDFRLIYPRHGQEAAHYLPFLEEGKEAAMLLSHYMFSLTANPSVPPTVSHDEQEEERGVITAGDLPLGDFSPSALRRFTATQISAAREEVRRQESLWRRAIGKTASATDMY